MADENEVLFKIAADLSKLEPQFKDLSDFWKKHNEEIAKGEKAIDNYANNTVKSYEKVNNTIKKNVGQIGSEAKTVQNLEKTFEKLNDTASESFDTTKVKEFETLLNTISRDIGNVGQLNLTTEDLDTLTQKLSGTKDDFESLNVLIEFFEQKIQESSKVTVDSVDAIQKKIEETKLNIFETSKFIKEINKQIENTAPGRVQANLIGERNAAKKALDEEIISLKDYQNQLKAAKEANVSLFTELRKVKDEMAQLEIEGKRDSARWKELSEQSKKYGEAIRVTNEELRRTTSSTQGLDNLIGAAKGIVAAFSAAEGARALFGEGAEDLQKTLVKLNGAISLLYGLQTIQTEITKKETLAGKAYSAVQKQIAIATDSTAKSTLRLRAALNLLGIGLIVSAIALLVTHWKDIAKFVGIISDESERLNEVNKQANDIYGEQIAELKILTDRVKEGGLSFKEKAEAVETYNTSLKDTFGTVNDYQELEKRLIEQGAAYIKYLELKARAEAAYQLAIEKTKEALLKRTDTEVKFTDLLSSIGPGGAFIPPSVVATVRNQRQASELEEGADALLKIQRDTLKQMEELAKEMGLVLADPAKKLSDDAKKISSLFEELIRKQKQLKIQLIENDQEREKAGLLEQFEAEKQAYAKQISELKATEEQKRKLREEFNKLYSEQTGLAYEELQRKLADIDKKYADELEKVQLNALRAIDSVLLGDDERDRKAIIEKWDTIRKEIQDQIDKTNDEFSKETLTILLDQVNVQQGNELGTFDLETGIKRIDREKEIAETILKIYQKNTKDILKDENLRELQLLELQRNYLSQLLTVYKNSLANDEQKSAFQSLIDQLQTSVNPSEIADIGKRLRAAFGDETAEDILKVVEALKDVQKEIDTTQSKIKTGFAKVIQDISEWTSSLDSFSKKLAETIGLEGKEAEDFAKSISFAIQSTFDSLNSIFQAEIDQRKKKIESIQESIDAVEDQLDRERELYEQGFANNYDLRRKDLEDLKARKQQEEEELKKAQKRKAALAKTELVLDSISQLTNLITAASNIFKWASKIPFVGIPLAVGLIATMFGAFAIAKGKAFQAIGQGQSFRKGLAEGPVNLKGPKHEEGGFGVYNSRSGEKVAEFEDDEDVFVVNRQQRSKYKHILDALIADAKGRASIDSTLEGYYHKPKLGETTTAIVKHVNMVTVKAENIKKEASAKNEDTLQELKKLNDNFTKEFEGHRREREEQTHAWETPEHFYVKKGRKTKRYTKK